MKKIKINIPQNPYHVYLGENIFSNVIDIMKSKNLSGNIFLIIDHNIEKFYAAVIKKTFQNNNYKKIIVIASEKNKSYETLQKIHNALIKNKFNRDSILIAIGGGIIGDLSGFAASTYMRGIKYVQIPTTLLAAVDSSVGGKTGLNFNGIKNIVGSFYQPEFVLVDTKFFTTLPQKEMLCGLGEVIKYGFLTNEKYFKFISKNIDKILSNDKKVIQKIIYESIKFKGDVVEADERENGIRKILNLGHTFAHALEVDQNHKIKHGEAVIVGINCALYLAGFMNILSQKSFIEFNNFLKRFNEKIKIKSFDKDSMYKTMLRDKKNRSNKIKFVLMKEIGNLITDIPADKILINNAITKGIVDFTND
ncbi:MAG: 3-dehydroquinate synthase [Ignavibacteriae bacterium]|nr:MAG: 3-dehydroquinate synthase [Ignavibacteriota bacterium]